MNNEWNITAGKDALKLFDMRRERRTQGKAEGVTVETW